MAIFGKSKKADANASAPVEETRTPQQTKGKKEKKAKIIMRNLRFEDSVMKMVYESMDRESGAVRKVDGGYEIAIRALYTYLGGEFEVYENDDNSR